MHSFISCFIKIHVVTYKKRQGKKFSKSCHLTLNFPLIPICRIINAKEVILRIFTFKKVHNAFIK